MVLDAAMKMASRDGLEGLTIGQLAGELKLSKAGLILHFGSKEALQLQVLEEAVRRFTERVVVPAFSVPEGVGRLQAILDHWLAWGKDPYLPGGCPLVAAGMELDDQEGPLRDYLVEQRRLWLEALADSAHGAVRVGEFREALDIHLFAFEYFALVLGFHHAQRLLRDPRAEGHVRLAIASLFERCRA
ncbi:MAG: TetR/AcrR family transcriptional regulator [Armatimonadetes bacterium]|nr:TetR/AcrR family transcriptional regulator [Armatimonadota bacterium]